MRNGSLAATGVVLFLALGTMNHATSPAGKALAKEPRYTADGQLIRPDDYRTWVFAGANLGLRYAEGAATPQRERDRNQDDETGDFHNIYINAEAYAHYGKTGKFPDGTVLVMDVYTALAKEPQNIVDHGHFPGAQDGFEVAVKNSKRPDGSSTVWAYYLFDGPGGKLLSTAKAQPNKTCYECHKQHAADDNVWVQFYPTLRAATQRKPAAR